MIEKEVRYKINEEIKKKIICSSSLIEEKREYVDLVMGRYGFDSLEKLGYIVRLRSKAGVAQMESKKKLEDFTWEENNIPITNILQGYNFLSSIGYKPYLYINRKREIRSVKEAIIAIDNIELLGMYVEFELQEGYSFEDIEKYIKEVGIYQKPAPLYGDIFRERLKDTSFKDKFEKGLEDFLNNN